MCTLPDALQRFLGLYASGRYWDSHEALEDAWRETRSDFYQALILYASAWVHWERGNAHGTGAQLAKTLDRLEGYSDTHLGFDVAAIRRHCLDVREELQAHPDGWRARIRPLPVLVRCQRRSGQSG